MPLTAIRDILANAFSKFQQGYFQLQVNQRLYVNAAVGLVAFCVASAILGEAKAKGILFIAIAFWMAAIFYNLISFYKKIYESVLGKGFIVLLFSLCANLAIALSSQLVNDISGVDPSKFPHTIALLSILCIPPFVAVGFSILYGFLLFATPLMLMFHALPDEKTKEVLLPGYSAHQVTPYYKTTRVIQFISLAVFCGFVFSLSQKVMRNYEIFLTNTARSFLYQLEMYPKTPCGIEEGGRAAFLSDEMILVGIKNSAGITFKVQECKANGV